MKVFTSTVAVSRRLLTAMPSNQKEFQRLLSSHGYQIYFHLLKIYCYPNNESINHWKAEVRNHLLILSRHRRTLKINLNPLDFDTDLRSKFKFTKEYARLAYLGKPILDARPASQAVIRATLFMDDLIMRDSLSYEDLSSIFNSS